MSDITQKSEIVTGEAIDLKELISVLWGGKTLIAVVTSLASVVAVLVALAMPNFYTASALLAPADASGGGLSGLMKQYGGLASLAGVALPVDEGSRAQLGMELMKSRAFIGEFVQRHNILPELMAVDSWDSGSGEVVFDTDIYDPKSHSWVREVKPPRSSAPSLQEAHKEFLTIFRVSQDKLTSYVSVSIEHQSPILAAKWVNLMVQDVNAAVKHQDVAEAERSIAYLKQQIAKTSLADLQAMFFELIQSQTETVMLAEVRPEYVFKTIDPAVIPEMKSKPSRALICILGTLLGGLLGVIMVLIRHFSRQGLESKA